MCGIFASMASVPRKLTRARALVDVASKEAKKGNYDASFSHFVVCWAWSRWDGVAAARSDSWPQAALDLYFAERNAMPPGLHKRKCVCAVYCAMITS